MHKFDPKNSHYTRGLHGFGVVELNTLVDTRRGLEAAFAILFSEHKGVTHFKVTQLDNSDGNCIELLWADDRSGACSALPYQLEDPNEVTEFIGRWAQANGKWPQHPGGDSDHLQGFRVQSGYGYRFGLVAPSWVVYSK